MVSDCDGDEDDEDEKRDRMPEEGSGPRLIAGLLSPPGMPKGVNKRSGIKITIKSIS